MSPRAVSASQSLLSQRLGGGCPVKLGPKAVVDPYGHDNPLYQSGDAFRDYFCAAMAQRMARFREIRGNSSSARTPASAPLRPTTCR